MRFGWLAEQRLSWFNLFQRAVAVQRLGYRSVWLSDHLIDDEGRWLLDCWTSAAGLAAVPDIEIGTLVAANTLRHPAITAHLTRSLAQITGGRFVLGIGAGGSVEEHVAIGMPFPQLAERVALLNEACAAIRGMLDGTPADVAGKYYRLRMTGGDPTGVPLLVGGASRAVLEVAARHANRWTVWADPEGIAAGRAELATRCVAEGRDVRDIRCGAIVMVIPAHLPARESAEGWPAVLAGDADAMQAQVRRYANSGAEEIVVCDYAVEEEARMQALQWFAEQVVDQRP